MQTSILFDASTTNTVPLWQCFAQKKKLEKKGTFVLTVWNSLHLMVLRDVNSCDSDYFSVWMTCDLGIGENQNYASFQWLTIWTANWWACQENDSKNARKNSIWSQLFWKTFTWWGWCSTNRPIDIPVIVAPASAAAGAADGMLHCRRRWNIPSDGHSIRFAFAHIQWIGSQWWLFQRHSSEEWLVRVASGGTPPNFDLINVTFIYYKRNIVGQMPGSIYARLSYATQWTSLDLCLCLKTIIITSHNVTLNSIQIL